jgi:hypothetical protein
MLTRYYLLYLGTHCVTKINSHIPKGPTEVDTLQDSLPPNHHPTQHRLLLTWIGLQAHTCARRYAAEEALLLD